MACQNLFSSDISSPFKELKFGYDLQIRYEPFFMDCHPDQETAVLPNLFNREHSHEIANSVLLCDPIGNMFQIIVEVHNGEVFFVKGWNDVVKFYGLLFGGWANLVYVRSDRFMLKMKDRLDQEIKYPSPARIQWVGDTPKLLGYPPIGALKNQLLKICQKPDLFHVLEKTLTFADVYSGRLHIPNDFCVVAFRQSNVRVVVYDDYGTEVSCFLKFRNDSPGSCGIEDGWYRFCLIKALQTGMRVHLAVPSTNPTMMSFSIINN